MSAHYNIVTPGTTNVLKTINYQTSVDALNAITKAKDAQKTWKLTKLSDRIQILNRFVDAFCGKSNEIAEELTRQMGRPIKYTSGEVKGFEERARFLISIAKESLEDYRVPEKDGFNRFIRREALGVVFIIAAWNYPYLIMVNGVVPALLAGNTVIIKQSPQTFLCAERFAEAFKQAGLPEGVFQYLHIDHPTAEIVIRDPRIDFIHFTGSVGGGKAVNKIASDRFAGTAFELGGKDPAYVREDADVKNAAENIVDGAMFNSGQSCCGIERVYVHEKVYDEFIKIAVQVTKDYVLGDPLDPKTTLGPVISTQAAKVIREHIHDAVSKGATCLIEESLFPTSKADTSYVAPQLLINVHHGMKVMSEETFGPVVGIMKVKNDYEAIQLMNDSKYGLTASIWTKDENAALEIGEKLETGTVFMNRCDYLDPALAWTGVKDTGRGCTLSKYGFDSVTRPKSFHLRK